MTRVIQSADIGHPPDVVFRNASDPEEQLRWDRRSLQRVERLSSRPLGVGARYRGDFRGVGWIEWEILEFDPPHRYTHLTKIPLGPDAPHLYVRAGARWQPHGDRRQAP